MSRNVGVCKKKSHDSFQFILTVLNIEITLVFCIETFFFFA